MGLLRKAARAGAHLAASSSPSAHIAPEGAAQGAGLLRKTLGLLASGKVLAAPLRPFPAQPSVARAAGLAPGEGASAEAVAQLIIDEMSALGNGVELPSRLFTALKKHLSVTKGALLLYDPARLEYAPWASVGYDETTLHRLRIPLGANETFNALANGRALSVTDDAQRGAYQQYFSSREFSMAGRVRLTPFISEETLAGVLLVTDLKAAFSREEELLSCLEKVAHAASPLVQKARARLTRAAPVRAARPSAETAEQQLSRLLLSPAGRGKKYLFASLSLAAYAQRIIASHEDLEPFRLSEDIRYFLECFLADVGMVLVLAPNVFLVCLEELPRASLDLMVHQLGLYLGSLFEREAGAVPAGIEAAKSRVWPDEGSDVRELLAFFAP